jgi:PAS domain S-box-containing protein
MKQNPKQPLSPESAAEVGAARGPVSPAEEDDRKAVELELRETEYFLTKSQEIARLGSYAFDITTGLWKCTPVLDEIFGIGDKYPKNADGWLQLVAPEQREEMRDHLLHHVVTLRHRFDREYRIIRPNDRQERWVCGFGELEYDATGRPIRMIGTIQDITERKRAEEALRLAHRRLCMLSDCNEALIRSADETELFRTVCRIAIEIGGYRMTWVGLAEDDEPKTVRPVAWAGAEDGYVALANVSWADTERGRGPIGIAIRTGSPCPVQNILDDFCFTPWLQEAARRGFASVCALPLTANSRTFGALCIYSSQSNSFDATETALLQKLADNLAFGVAAIRTRREREHAQEALHNSERKLAEIFRASPAFISVSTLADGRILEVNESYATLLGFQRDEVIGRTVTELNLWPTHTERSKMLDLVNKQGRIENLESRLRRKSGEIIDVLMSMAPITIEGQACLITIATDIGEHKRAEKARLEMERRLLHAQKLESLGVLAGGIAHDFNNLLMAILGNLDLALMDMSPVAPARSSIEQSAIAARRAADLTRQMLAYSGKASFDVRHINLSELLEENAHLFRACISKMVVFNVQLDRGLPLVNADSGQIQQVIMNLITNASEAIGDQPGVISLSTGVQTCDTATLSVSRVTELPPSGRFVCLEVTDTGCGMDNETQLRLFDPFFSTKLMGRGLGMSAILGIMRAHQGAIFVDSTVGKGTTIRVLFPAEPPPPAAAKLSAPIEILPEGSPAKPATVGTVLVVDDEDMVRKVCAQILRRLGWNVITASNGPEAIKLYGENVDGITCVVLDQSMPQMDGMTVFRELRVINPGAQVILSSGYSNDQGAGQRLAAEGLAGFIQKPYTIDSLRQQLARILQREG